MTFLWLVLFVAYVFLARAYFLLKRRLDVERREWEEIARQANLLGDLRRWFRF